MMPQPQAAALREAARRESTASAGAELDAVQALLAEHLPALESCLREATAGPKPLDEAALHLVGAGGKRVRPMCCLLMANATGADPTDVLPIAAAAELVHSATLLHDDVIDEGEQRRGRAASRVLWGNLVSVLSGDLLLTRALTLVDGAGVPGVMTDLLTTLERLVAGEVAQLQARNRLDLGSEGYLRIVEGKTASLFGFVCRAGARAGGAAANVVDAAGEFGEQVGIAFQIVDDVLDLSGDPGHVGKRLGADLAEGKTTLPLALALDEAGDDLAEWLPAARTGEEAATVAVSAHPAVRRGCDRARELASERSDAALAALGQLPSGHARDLLRTLAVLLTGRER